jgi:hypothetical protein
LQRFVFIVPLAPNTRGEPRARAGARDERRLLRVGSSAMLGAALTPRNGSLPPIPCTCSATAEAVGACHALSRLSCTHNTRVIGQKQAFTLRKAGVRNPVPILVFRIRLPLVKDIHVAQIAQHGLQG